MSLLLLLPVAGVTAGATSAVTDVTGAAFPVASATVIPNYEIAVLEGCCDG